MFTAGIITSSDKGYAGEREDLSGQVIREILEAKGYDVVLQTIVPDEKEVLAKAMLQMSDDLGVNLLVTTGGTGFSQRDVTPEATSMVVERLAPGISEAMRAYSLSITKRAMLSRGISGIRGNTLIVNLPGSPKAVRESLDYIIDTLDHGLEILLGQAKECASDGPSA